MISVAAFRSSGNASRTVCPLRTRGSPSATSKREIRLVVRFKMRANGSAVDLAAIFEGRTVGGSDVDELVGKHRGRLGADDPFQLSPRAQPDGAAIWIDEAPVSLTRYFHQP